jgi:hypothetical protein
MERHCVFYLLLRKLRFISTCNAFLYLNAGVVVGYCVQYVVSIRNVFQFSDFFVCKICYFAFLYQK